MREERIWVGTFAEGAEPGIHVLGWNEEHLQLRKISSGAENGSSNLTLTPDGYLLACVEKAEFLGVPGGGLVSYVLDGDMLCERDAITGLGIGSCHVAYAPRRRLVCVANYQDGSVDVLALGKDGRLDRLRHIERAGSGPRPEQAGPHAHCCLITPDEEMLFVCDLGADEITGYALPSLRPLHALPMPPGSGPRHAVLSPGKRLLYVACELSNEVCAVRMEEGALLQRLPWRMESPAFKALSSIRLAPDQRTLIVGCRGENGILLYRIGENDWLSEPEWIPTAYDYPWDVIPLNTDGSLLMAAFTRSNRVQVLKRDSAEWSTVAEVEIPCPTCLLAAWNCKKAPHMV